MSAARVFSDERVRSSVRSRADERTRIREALVNNGIST